MPQPTKAQLDEYADENERLAEFHRATAALAENTARETRGGVTEETDEFHRLNDAVIAAGKNLPKRFRYLAKG